MASTKPARTPTTTGAEWDHHILLIDCAVILVVGVWAWRAFSDPNTYDFGLAYVGGQIAWSTGHPETWFSWTGTPVLAAAMASTTRLWGVTTAGRLLTCLNIVLVVGTIGIVVRRLRNVLSPLWLWIVALGLASFGPVLSTVWWKQFNIIALVLALAGFAALRRGRAQLSGGLIGFSVAVKPLAILLPFVLLARRQTRPAGIWACIYAVGLNLGAQGLLALHAHSAGVFNPLTSLQNFSDKSKPAKGLACSTFNFSPQALLCRTFGSRHWTLLEVAAWALTAILAVWLVRTLRGYGTDSWEAFAFSCVFSVMVSPIAWSHYQVMLAPLFVLLVVRFTTVKTEAIFWVGLAAAYVLASLIWTPYGTITTVAHLRIPTHVEVTPPTLANIAQYSQYILVVTGVVWYRRHGRVAALNSVEQLSTSGHL